MKNPEVASMGRPLNTGPNTGSIVAMEQEVLDRARRLRGWAAAAKLHERAEGVASDVCRHCTRLLNGPGELVDDPYVEVPWPCVTAGALGLDR